MPVTLIQLGRPYHTRSTLNPHFLDCYKFPMSDNTFSPGPTPDTVKSADGQVLTPPAGWVLLPPGDAALTRRVKKLGEFWIVQEKKGRRTFSKGVWAPAATIEQIRSDLVAERSTDAYAKRQKAAKVKREKVQTEYVEDFQSAVVKFLDFHSAHAELSQQMATAIAEHATPVGSGTVARTKRIPIEKRAEAAVIAWMRHNTTAYDSMKIARVKGRRREVRRMLAQHSKQLLRQYRKGDVAVVDCPLQKALTTQ